MEEELERRNRGSVRTVLMGKKSRRKISREGKKIVKEKYINEMMKILVWFALECDVGFIMN